MPARRSIWRRARRAVPFLATLTVVGCHDAGDHAGSGHTAPAASAAATSIGAEPPLDRGACANPLPVFRQGKEIDRLCPDAARRAGLTVVNLSSRWSPSLFGRDLPYRKTLLDLAAERFEALPEGHRAHKDRYLELYGITPTIAVIAKRLSESARHACHQKIDDTALTTLKRPLDVWRSPAKQRDDRWRADTLEERLRFGMQERGVETFAKLRDDKAYGPTLVEWERVAGRVGALRAAKAHLACDGLIDDGSEDRVLDLASIRALHTYHRRHMLVSWTLDRETATTMARDSRENDFRSLLRALRERVADATGLIEDGSASGGPVPVVGRRLDSLAFLMTPKGSGQPKRGAPDRIGRAADAAARALGWTSPDAAMAFLKAQSDALDGLVVALPLPPPPAYHKRHMKLRAEVDRGQLWYDYPYTLRGHRKLPLPKRRPSTTLIAEDASGEIALVRWGTTIGGWKPERVAGLGVRMQYKESPVGARMWRDLIVAPRWLPPASTPSRDLVVPTRRGYRLKTSLIGPSYASAYGLMMLIHHRADTPSQVTDQGIRTHGSVSYDSIHKGESHGCHRLHNHRAVRLGSFLLKHRRHVVRGAEPLPFQRRIAIGNRALKLDFDTRGHRYELDPPVPVEVLRGTIMGKRTRAAARGVPLPSSLAKRFMAER